MLIPDLTPQQAAEFAERLRLSVAELAIAHVTSPAAAQLSISIGVHTAVPETATEGASLLQAADDALYQAKHQGRNQVVTRH
jgi:diguanylate cyclase (GGDEF)-like protein